MRYVWLGRGLGEWLVRLALLGGSSLALVGGLAGCGGEDGSGPPSAQSGNSNTGASSGSGGKNAGTGGKAQGGQLSSGGASGATSTPPNPSDKGYGEPVSGQYHLGPVDFGETEWHNACAPAGGYRQALRDATGLGGEFLAGLSNEHAGGGSRCDACIAIRTATGRAIVARVVTYGVEAEPGDIDVSPSVYEALNTGEYPRSMTWQFTDCPGSAKLQYEFQTGANVWWTSFWVRNGKVPIEKVEVQSANNQEFLTLRRELDGTLNADSGFGEGTFTLRLTGAGGRVLTDSFPKFEPGQLISSEKQF
ncbi:MAG TPA: hypothetical protein VFQ61_12450 [Polyangiaceae bacterium]|nr:hypothetical protein [Polyangiaceae bacterium]